MPADPASLMARLEQQHEFVIDTPLRSHSNLTFETLVVDLCNLVGHGERM